MTCRELIEFLMEYTAGDLPDPEKQSFDRHLGACVACRAYLDTYRQTIALGRAAFPPGEEALPENVPDDLVQAILAAREKGK